jgi:hypothetical protein
LETKRKEKLSLQDYLQSTFLSGGDDGKKEFLQPDLKLHNSDFTKATLVKKCFINSISMKKLSIFLFCCWVQQLSFSQTTPGSINSEVNVKELAVPKAPAFNY